jgi:SAM-dependent methyltransferase
VITPDGCAVDFYALMPAFGEPAIVHDAIGPGASILELACGAGRVTHPLIALGHLVVPVDESAQMLAHVRGAETVCARIQGLSLGRRFGAVLLASHLINTDAGTRSAFLAACRRHVADDGCVIVQQHSPEWFAAAETEDIRDGVTYRLRDVSRPAPNLLTATAEYVVGDRCWTQTFTTTRLDEPELAAALAEAGLRLDRYLTDDRSWFRAVPADAPGR